MNMGIDDRDKNQIQGHRADLQQNYRRKLSWIKESDYTYKKHRPHEIDNSLKETPHDIL